MENIEIVKPEFIVGDEKRFYDFVGELNEKEKVALISHTDLDGIAAAKVINEVVQADIVKFIGYSDLNKNLIQYLKEKKVKRVIFSDLFIKDPEFVRELEKIAKVLIIDHHSFLRDWNSDRTVFLNAQGYCATYIGYYLSSKVQNLEYYDWLVACACVADWCYSKNSFWMKQIYEKYGDKFIDDIKKIKKGKMWDLQLKLVNSIVYFDDDLKKVFDSIGKKYGEIGELGKYSDEVEKDISLALENFEKEKKEIKGGYFWEIKSKFHVGSTISTILSERYWNSTIIIATDEFGVYHFSARRQDGKEDMNVLLSKLVEGFENASAGGHRPAAGGHVMLKDGEKFKKKLFEMR